MTCRFLAFFIGNGFAAVGVLSISPKRIESHAKMNFSRVSWLTFQKNCTAFENICQAFVEIQPFWRKWRQSLQRKYASFCKLHRDANSKNIMRWMTYQFYELIGMNLAWLRLRSSTSTVLRNFRVGTTNLICTKICIRVTPFFKAYEPKWRKWNVTRVMEPRSILTNIFAHDMKLK